MEESHIEKEKKKMGFISDHRYMGSESNLDKSIFYFTYIRMDYSKFTNMLDCI
jgi:hypothetical protein